MHGMYDSNLLEFLNSLINSLQARHYTVVPVGNGLQCFSLHDLSSRM